MIHLFPVLLLGVVILALLVWFLARTKGQDNEGRVTIEQFSQAQQSIDSLIPDLCIVRRTFAREDMEFISRQPDPEVSRAFLKERGDLAISSVRMMRNEIGQLIDLHFKLASYTYEPSSRFEFKLAAHYLLFIVICNVLILAVKLRGPFEVGNMLDRTMTAAEQFCFVVSNRLENTNPGRLDPARQIQAA